jgi:hypothetical protein
LKIGQGLACVTKFGSNMGVLPLKEQIRCL